MTYHLHSVTHIGKMQKLTYKPQELEDGKKWYNKEVYEKI